MSKYKHWNNKTSLYCKKLKKCVQSISSWQKKQQWQQWSSQVGYLRKHKIVLQIQVRPVKGWQHQHPRDRRFRLVPQQQLINHQEDQILRFRMKINRQMQHLQLQQVLRSPSPSTLAHHPQVDKLKLDNLKSLLLLRRHQ